MLKLRSVAKLIRRFRENSVPAEDMVRAGLERMAFGEINGVMELVLADEPPGLHRLMQMNLFNVSEVKRIKGGGLEIKIFDRQKAMEKLLELSEKHEQSQAAQDFFTSLSEAAKMEETSSDEQQDTEL